MSLALPLPSAARLSTPVTSPLRINLDLIACAMLFMAIFAGFQGGRYYMANRLQELGIACSLGLFAMGMWRAAFLLSFSEWKRWVIKPLVLVGGIMGVSAVVFTLNYAGSVLYSFFSAREFLLAFLGPGLYLLVRTGLPLSSVRAVIWVTLVALMLNYLFFYFTMDLRQAFFSSDHTVSNLVTYDEWRGFRLKPPLFAIMVALMASLLTLFQSRSALQGLCAALVVALGAFIWSIVMFRSTLATMVLSMSLYPALLCHRNRLKLILIGSPLALILIPVVASFALDNFMQADGGSIRAKAFGLAFEHIQRHPLFGAGEDSAYGQSYQDIVAFYFFPSDLGLAGVTYKYGALGLCLYLFMHGKIWLTLWRANLAEKTRAGRIDALCWAMLMFMTAQTFNLALNPGLAYAQGITLGSLALAYASLLLPGGNCESRCKMQ